MKKTLLLLVLLLTSVASQSQRIHAYLGAGAITSQIEGDELKGFKHWSGTGSVGALAYLNRDGSFSMTMEAGYSCRGVLNNSHSSQNPYNITLDLHYIDIPITFFYRDPYGGIRIGAGISYSRLLAQPHGEIKYNPNYFVPDSSNMEFLKNDLAAAIEARFPIWKGLQFCARFQYSVLPVKRNWQFTEIFGQSESRTWSNNCYNSSLSFRLIWQFGDERFHKKRNPNSNPKRRR